ncbi:hypothetical protein SDC9_70555 [bioreactor metagenome]|uniref:Uncharacterized protein n=1 Tax=bioreactor metagenome TaxID=1076179 RepID=A0A644YD56_9ZZZZ
MTAVIRRDIFHLGVVNNRGRVNTVAVARAHRHDAIGREENRGRNTLKLLLLILPGCAEISLEVGVLLELWVAVGGQHLTVGVNVHAFPSRLLQQHLEVVQVVAGHHNKGALLDFERYDGRNRIAVGFGVGRVQNGHALEVDAAELHQKGQPFLHRVIVCHRRHTLNKPSVDRWVTLAQNPCVMGIGRHTAHAEQQRGAQRDEVFVPVKKLLCSREQTASGSFSCRPDLGRVGSDIALVKVDVGDCDKESVHNQVNMLSAAVTCLGKADHFTGQHILLVGHIRLFATDTRHSASGASCSLLTLETEHFAHDKYLPIFLFYTAFFGSKDISVCR